MHGFLESRETTTSSHRHTHTHKPASFELEPQRNQPVGSQRAYANAQSARGFDLSRLLFRGGEFPLGDSEFPEFLDLGFFKRAVSWSADWPCLPIIWNKSFPSDNQGLPEFLDAVFSQAGALMGLPKRLVSVIVHGSTPHGAT